MPDTIKRKRKKHLRNLPRNKSGRKETVRMVWGEGENKKGKKRYYANPSITFKGVKKHDPNLLKRL